MWTSVSNSESFLSDLWAWGREERANLGTVGTTIVIAMYIHVLSSMLVLTESPIH